MQGCRLKGGGGLGGLTPPPPDFSENEIRHWLIFLTAYGVHCSGLVNSSYLNMTVVVNR